MNTGQGTARGSSQHWGQVCSLQWATLAGGEGRALSLPQQHPLSYSSFCLAPGSASQPTHHGWLVPLPRTPAGLGVCDGDVKGSGAQCLSLGMLKDCHTLPWLYLGTGQLLAPRVPWSDTGATGSIRCSQRPNLPVPGRCVQHLSTQGSRRAAWCQPPLCYALRCKIF